MNLKLSFPFLSTLALAVLACAVVAGGTSVAQTAEGQGDESQNTKPNPNSISGRVLTPTGQPVTNATVFVSRLNSPSPPRPTPAGADGSFQVAGLEPGVFNVTASAPSYIVPLRENENALVDYYRVGDSVAITMFKGGVINGTVTDTDGQPLVALRVRALMLRDANGQQSNPSMMSERLTDDRGVYRLYGLAPGTYVVSAGGGGDGGLGGVGGGGGRGRGGGGPGFGVFNGRVGSATALYDRDAPTFAPSSTRDTAAEVTVFAGEEVSNIDVKFRGEPGHVVSGTVKAPGAAKVGYTRSSVTMSRAKHEGEVVSSATARGSAFAFYGVADGEYELLAQTSLGPDDTAVSQPGRVTVNGANVTGLVLTTNPLASISGHVALEMSTAPECKNKRQPRFDELLISVQRDVMKGSKVVSTPQFSSARGAPGKNGDFVLNGLGPGQYRLDTRFFAKYWYLRAITLPSAPTAKSHGKNQPDNQTAMNQTTDAARNGVALKFGTHVTGLVVALAEGAASVRGHLTTAENEKLPSSLFVYLVPAEKDQSDNLLRFFTAPVGEDGSFALSNLPPGVYWTVTRTAGEAGLQTIAKLRMPEGAETRAMLRRDGATAKTTIELRPCQNVSDYQLPLPAPLQPARNPLTVP
jgi:hypothetical protein